MRTYHVRSWLILTNCARTSDPYARLRVPLNRKILEAVFFLSFLVLYYAVLMERNRSQISSLETFLYIWIAAFAYEEFGDLSDAGVMFYGMDFWSIWDLGIVGTGIAFLTTRESLLTFSK